jgi:hypothetical protein
MVYPIVKNCTNKNTAKPKPNQITEMLNPDDIIKNFIENIESTQSYFKSHLENMKDITIEDAKRLSEISIELGNDIKRIIEDRADITDIILKHKR